MAILPIQGGPPVKLVDKSDIWPWVWMSDGRALLYADERGGVGNLWSLPLDGSTSKQLTDFGTDRIFDFALSLDGKRLAVARGTVKSDVVMISNFR